MDTEPFTLAKSTEDLHALVEKLKGDLPLSSYVYNSALIHARKYGDSYVYYTVRSPPECNIVLWKHKENQMCVGFHCPEKEVPLLEKCLKSTKIIDFTKSICIFHVPDYLLETLQNIAKETVGEEMTYDAADDFTFDSSERKDPLECPTGFKVYRLGKAGVELMHNNWRYKTAVPLQDIIDLTRHVASVGIHKDSTQKEAYVVDTNNIPFADDDKIPVSWIAACIHGPIGMQMTEKEFRKRGFASLLSQICGQMMAEQGFFPHTSVEDDLKDLRRLFDKLPGWKFNRKVTWLWQIIDDDGKVVKRREC